ncbi:D-glycero-beta-D-manno-heptose 1,7-bisphosphate 7-phosphatase [Microbulbifer sp. 2205BS26-8]|uniref:D-glycero-beta-D-manno-heptose 1,7-bisphosphate 7-phosphatase n=1 Tax=Microbulbifer sp. 2205BS26-8 TaxID=3064386 RepID=UPI00273CF57E|nr:D-glycero-beta-D-manno-heptose 1,7-bisphosphate 7-phosphatase [Microbulbifer sp. 2205BS26-8]MDP5209858.1 D-glycero-beta-D-manno-heptose 1,7-bisphosphate 7-phosphatase [Microbulbifer sp. 2205BS26-8]
MPMIILGRDGVINEAPDTCVRSADEWQPLPGSIEALAALSRAGYQLVIATNQSGLTLGRFDLDDLEAIHTRLRALVEDAGGEIAAIFYCPHGPEDHCRCRKPKPGLLEAIEAEFDTSLYGCYLLGDKLEDLQLALAKGCKPVLLKSGEGERTLKKIMAHSNPHLENTVLFADLAQFAQFLLDGCVEDANRFPAAP